MATAVAPRRRAAVSARSADALPNGWSGVAMTLKPSRRWPHAGPSTAIDRLSTRRTWSGMPRHGARRPPVFLCIKPGMRQLPLLDSVGLDACKQVAKGTRYQFDIARGLSQR